MGAISSVSVAAAAAPERPSARAPEREAAEDGEGADEQSGAQKKRNEHDMIFIHTFIERFVFTVQIGAFVHTQLKWNDDLICIYIFRVTFSILLLHGVSRCARVCVRARVSPCLQCLFRLGLIRQASVQMH